MGPMQLRYIRFISHGQQAEDVAGIIMSHDWL